MQKKRKKFGDTNKTPYICIQNQSDKKKCILIIHIGGGALTTPKVVRPALLLYKCVRVSLATSE